MPVRFTAAENFLLIIVQLGSISQVPYLWVCFLGPGISQKKQKKNSFMRWLVKSPALHACQCLLTCASQLKISQNFSFCFHAKMQHKWWVNRLWCGRTTIQISVAVTSKCHFDCSTTFQATVLTAHSSLAASKASVLKHCRTGREKRRFCRGNCGKHFGFIFDGCVLLYAPLSEQQVRLFERAESQNAGHDFNSYCWVQVLPAQP